MDRCGLDRIPADHEQNGRDGSVDDSFGDRADDGVIRDADGVCALVAVAGHGLDPYRYLLWLLQNAPQLSETDAAWAEKLLPANAQCHLVSKEGTSQRQHTAKRKQAVCCFLRH